MSEPAPDTDARGVPAHERSAQSAPAVHFPGLNGMRFWAAVGIICYHTELFKQLAGMPSWGQVELWRWIGPYSLVWFFAMSGFLIIYLLMEEDRRTGKVDARKFYVRRILRIWPLYYLVTLIGFVCIALFSEASLIPYDSGDGHVARILLYLFGMPSLAFAFYGVIPFIGPLWSIGVEQHFYFTVPELIRRRKETVVGTLVGVIVLMVALRAVLPPLASALSPGDALSRPWWIALEILRIYQLECMAVGGLGAVIVFRQDRRWLDRIFHPAAQLAAWGLVLLCASVGIRFGPFDNAIWAALFTVMILNLGANPKTLIRLENAWLDYLGKITYGLYLYHMFFIAFVFDLLAGRLPPDGLLFNALLYGSVLVGTAVTAALSYRYFERPMLLLKRRYMVVKSQVGQGPSE